MNRRTFLKLTGAAIAGLIVTPSIKAEPVILHGVDWQQDFADFGERRQRNHTLVWIPFTYATPQVGQKVLIASTSIHSNYIRGGTVIDRYVGTRDGSDFVTIPMKRDFSGRKRSDDNCIFAVYSDEGKKAIATKQWLALDGHTKITDFSKTEDKYIDSPNYMGTCFLKSHHCWMPVEGEYPDNIPPIPQTKNMLEWRPCEVGSHAVIWSPEYHRLET